jgi:hypothetical protein
MAIEFDNAKMQEALRASLIIEQQTEVLNDVIGDVAGDFGVNKPTAKKIIKAYAKDTLEKTQEKLEDERSSLANAEVMIEAVEGLTMDTDGLFEDKNASSDDEDGDAEE